MRHTSRLALLMILGFTLAARVGHGQVAVVPGSGGTTNNQWNGNVTIGWRFTLTSSVTVTQLGFFVANGSSLADPHPVGIWDSTPTLLFSATVPSGTPATLVDGFSFVPVTPYVLAPGNYTIGAYGNHFSPDQFKFGLTGSTTIPFLTLGDGVQSFPYGPTTLTWPNQTNGFAHEGYFGPNFMAAPAAGMGTPVTLTFTPGTLQSQIATFNCSSDPCTAPDAHSIKFTVSQVNSGFSVTLTPFYVPSDLLLEPGIGVGDGIAETGGNENTDYDWRWTQFFLGPAVTGGNLVPQCYAYSDDSCVYYRVSGDPGPGFYAGDIYVYIAWNTTLLPHGLYSGDYQTTPHMYDDPSDDTVQDGYPVIPGFPYSPENHQFVFDITTYYNPNPNQVGVDQGAGGKVRKFNDFALAFPLTNAALGLPTYTYTWLKPVDNPNFHKSTPASPVVLQLRFTLTPNTPTGVAVSSPHHVGVAILSGDCTSNPTPDKIQAIQVPAGSSPFFSYNSKRGDYEFGALTTFTDGQYSARVTSDLFPDQCTDFRIKH